ncbi:DUF881 domain-containing protein [Desertibacillus haloalkaliphilus]|uniref:DUF881 domain-containing protein n=1 Tax=Desertibacillus haloalkaliphilus TaxID=1328930 RepID=UPI0028AB5211|nr:DUF881 domain-containing protein [Desertibacillus haloalkaliphilus]
MRGKHVILSFVLLVTGFIVSLSYQYANENQADPTVSESQWRHEDELRREILMQQTANRDRQEQLRQVQRNVRELEAEIAQQEATYFNLVEDLEKLRKVTGKVEVQGPGIEVSLSDYSYVPEEGNPNDYIVHEQHIHKVVHELIVSDAEAIAINGQRISHHSYIQCAGPVIRIDGHTSYAPFVITAIGDPDKFEQSLNIIGGVKDQLVNDQIEVRIQKRDNIVLDPFLSEKG